MRNTQKRFRVLTDAHTAVPVRKCTVSLAIPVSIADIQRFPLAVIPILIQTTAILLITVLPIRIKEPVPSVSMSVMQARTIIVLYVIPLL